MRDDILNVIYAAIDDVNAQSADGLVIEKTPETPLLGEGGIDSLLFVNLIVAVEEQIQNKFGDPVVLVNEESMSLQTHPFRTVGSLAEYVGQLVLQV